MNLFNSKKQDAITNKFVKRFEKTEKKKENPRVVIDKSMIKLNKLLTKLSNIDNGKVDALRLATMYVESSGRDINLPQLIRFLKS